MFIKIVNLVVDAIGSNRREGDRHIADAESCERNSGIERIQNQRVEAAELNCRYSGSGLSQEGEYRGIECHDAPRESHETWVQPGAELTGSVSSCSKSCTGLKHGASTIENEVKPETNNYGQVQNGAGKSHKSGQAKSAESGGGYSGVFGALHYMNTRAEEVNFGSSVAHGWVKGVSLKVKDFCSRPQMVIVLALLPFLYMVSPKAVVLVPLLVVIGAAALVVQSFLPVYIGLDFSLMGAVLGSVLFHPWIGVLCVVCTYVAAMMFPSGHQDALEYERIFLFSFLALIIPFIPVSDIMLKCVVATYIGEFMEMFWHKYGENYPWPMAFLKVFPRSLIYVYVFHQTLGFLV